MSRVLLDSLNQTTQRALFSVRQVSHTPSFGICQKRVISLPSSAILSAHFRVLSVFSFCRRLSYSLVAAQYCLLIYTVSTSFVLYTLLSALSYCALSAANAVCCANTDLQTAMRERERES